MEVTITQEIFDDLSTNKVTADLSVLFQEVLKRPINIYNIQSMNFYIVLN